MKFNLSHFLAKRNLTIETWLSQNNISSFEDYELFLKQNDFVDSLQIQEHIKKIFSMKKLPMEFPATPIAENDSLDIETVDSKEESSKEESSKEESQREEKSPRKKRLKTNSE